jgi:hypothetical protein
VFARYTITILDEINRRNVGKNELSGWIEKREWSIAVSD